MNGDGEDSVFSEAVLRRVHLSTPSHLDLNFTMDFQPHVWLFVFVLFF